MAASSKSVKCGKVPKIARPRLGKTVVHGTGRGDSLARSFKRVVSGTLAHWSSISAALGLASMADARMRKKAVLLD